MNQQQNQPTTSAVPLAVSAIALKPLSTREKLFVAEYMVDEHGGNSVLRAGYKQTKGAAAVTATRLLKKAKIQVAIDAYLQARNARMELTGDMVIAELRKLAFSNMLDYIRVVDGEALVDLSKMTREQAACIQEVTVESFEEHDPNGKNKNDTRTVKRTKFKLVSKHASLALLAEHFGLLTKKIHLTGANGIALFASAEERAAAIKQTDGLSERELIARFKETVNTSVRGGRQSGSAVH